MGSNPTPATILILEQLKEIMRNYREQELKKKQKANDTKAYLSIAVLCLACLITLLIMNTPEQQEQQAEQQEQQAEQKEQEGILLRKWKEEEEKLKAARRNAQRNDGSIMIMLAFVVFMLIIFLAYLLLTAFDRVARPHIHDTRVIRRYIENNRRR